MVCATGVRRKSLFYDIRTYCPISLRPKPLGSGFFAFLHPPVPLIPSVPSDVDDAGRSAETDSALFPSDEQLNQRALWIAFLIVLGWALVGLIGALPLYMVSLPCLADLPPVSTYGGAYSTLQDLSLARLLRLLDSGNINTSNLISVQKRGDSDPQNFRVRIIVLTVLALVVALLPALWKLIKEFDRLVAYRKRWVEVKCLGIEMGWLSATDAPGFVGWGEKRLKDFILKAGLSSSLDRNNSRNGHRHGGKSESTRYTRSGRSEDQPLNPHESDNLEVDIQSLFSIG